MYHIGAFGSIEVSLAETKEGKLYHMNKKQEANALVIECITEALLEMMEKKPFNSITITDLTKRAGVGRVSFYRNFESKEEVIRRHLNNLIDEWSGQYGDTGPEPSGLNEKMFEYFYQNRELYIMLYRQGLAHISLQSIMDVCGPKPEQPNALAYFTSFIAHGIYGWIEEWFKRGVQETPKEMVALYEQTQKSDSK